MLGFRNIEDNTYNDIREKSLMQWLDDMEKHDFRCLGEENCDILFI